MPEFLRRTTRIHDTARPVLSLVNLGMVRAVLRIPKLPLGLLVLGFGAPGVAWAQSSSSGGTGQGVEIPNPDTQPVLLEADEATIVTRDPSLNIANGLYSYEDCTKNRKLRYQLNVANTDPTIPLEVWASQGADCTQSSARYNPNYQCWRALNGAVPNTAVANVVIRLQDIAVNNQGSSRPSEYVAGTAESCVNLNKIPFGIYFEFNRGTQNSVASTNTSITLDTVGPTPPDNVQSGVGENVAEVRWNLPAASTDVASYIVYCDDGSLTPTGQTTDAGTSSSSSSSSGETDAGTDADASTDVDAAAAQGVRPLQDESSSGTDTTSSSGATSSSGTSGAVVAEPGTSTACPANYQSGAGALVAGTLPSTTWTPCGKLTGGTSNRLKIEDLTNDQPYAFAVSATDQIGNPGPLSEVICNTPVHTTDFFEGYKAAGGQAGGCSVGEAALTSAAPVCGLGFAALALLRGAYRRRQRQDVSNR